MATTQNPAPHAPAHAKPVVGPISRRVGYAIAVVINVALLVIVNESPGWEALPFLTDDFALVLGIVNASIVAGVVANSVYVVLDPPWLRALGDIITTGVGLAALVRLWQVFPVDFPPAFVDLDVVARWVLAIGIIGSVIGIVAAAARLVRALTPPD
jgi:hypothetical protein